MVWPWIERIGLFAFGFAATSLVILGGQAVTRYEITLAYPVLAAVALGVLLWTSRPRLRPLAAGIATGSIVTTVLVWWALSVGG